MMGIVIISMFLFIAVFGIMIYTIIKQEKLPTESGRAKAISKRRARRASNGGTSYYITFETEQKLIEIRVFYPIFNSISEGDEGILYYKGNMFVDFKKESA